MNRARQLLDEGRKHCFYINTEVFHKDHGFIPVLVFENEPGCFPMTGDNGAEPWYWGRDLNAAEETARQMNRRMGLTDSEADRIVATSMIASMQANDLTFAPSRFALGARSN